MPTKFNRWGKPQNYDPSTGRYGEGEDNNKDPQNEINIELFGKQSGKGIDKQNDKEYNGNIKEPPKATGYNRPKTRHHNRHAQDMGLNEKEYVRAAIDFFNNGEGKLFLSNRSGKYYKYNEKNGILCVCSPEGSIHTFMFLSLQNFKRTKTQEQLEEI